MMKNLTPADTVAAIVSLLILTGAAWIAVYGPETPIPVHFDAAGQADRYGSRYELAAVLGGLALLNLLVNARDAVQGRADARVSVATRTCKLAEGEAQDLAAGAYVCVIVKDNGQGMDAETRRRFAASG